MENDYLDSSKKGKKFLIAFLVIFLVVVCVFIIIFSLNNSEPPKPSDSNNTDNVISSDEPEIKNDTEVLEDGKVEVTDFKIKYNNNDKVWYLSMVVHNKTSENINLKDYNVILYEDDQRLVSLEGTVLGSVKAKSKIVSVIVLEEIFKNTNRLEIVKK